MSQTKALGVTPGMENFLAKLAEVTKGGVEWELAEFRFRTMGFPEIALWRIRTKEKLAGFRVGEWAESKCCPATVLSRAPPFVFLLREVKAANGLTDQESHLVADAADQVSGYSPELREKLLAACGLGGLGDE